MKMLSLVTLFWGFILLAGSGSAVNAQEPNASPRAAATQTAAQNKDQQAQPNEKNEKKDDPGKDYRELFKDLLSLATWFFGVIGAIVLLLGGVIIWLVKWTLKETREDAKKALQEEMNRRGLGELEKVQRQIAALNSFKDRRIDWVYPASLPVPEKEKSFFVRMGLPAEHVRLVPVESVASAFILNNPSLVILSYDTRSKEAKDFSKQLLEKIVSLLRALPTPLLVYAPLGTRLEDDELRLLNETALHASANFPATVVTQALELIRLDQP